MLTAMLFELTNENVVEVVGDGPQKKQSGHKKEGNPAVAREQGRR